MKIIAISDTHGQHHNLDLPDGDMIIHAGDVSKRGKSSQIVEFLHWFSHLPYRHKIFIAGNHDFFFENAPAEMVEEILPDNVTYLNDSGITIDGIKIWGSPISPWFLDWAFNRVRGADIQQHWDLIPESTDIVITHGPVMKILDRTVRGENVGCEDLLKTMQKIKPSYHIAGHIHEAYGTEERDGTTYINASILNESYQITNQPIVLEFSTSK